MAAALMRRYAGEKIVVKSGGSNPAKEVHPNVAQALKLVDIDITGVVPYKFQKSDVEAADYIVTMGCGEACPRISRKGRPREYLDWPLPVSP